MPGQTFSDPHTGQAVVTLSWDMAERAVDVEASGTLLTRVSDIGTLRQAGMRGQTPLGESLSIRTLSPTGSLNFEVTRNGMLLDAGHVNFGVSGPRIDAPAAAMDTQKTAAREDGISLDDKGRLRQHGRLIDERRVRSDTIQRVDNQAISSGRTFLLVWSLIQTFGILFLMFLGFSGAKQDPSRPSGGVGLAIFTGVFLLIIITIAVAPWWIAFGLTFLKKNPGIGFHMARVLFWLTLIFSPIIGWAILYFAHKSMSKAIEASVVVRENAQLMGG
jgi:hypothetical protein